MTRSSRRLAAATMLAAIFCVPFATDALAQKTLGCADLVGGFHNKDTTIDSAVIVPAENGTPAHCDVRGLIGEAPEPGKGIRFAVWLPVASEWNGRFYMAGGGGYAGTISFSAMGVGLDMGYATASTDTGHDSSVFPLATFAFNDRKSEVDYAYRAVHRTVETAKRLMRAFYGEDPIYNYWVGCSTGGRQGLMEAQRFPHDFDGLITGAPVLDFTGTQIGGIWNAKALLGDGAISPAKLPLLAAGEYGSCDAVDGVVDGLIRDPRDCSFDPMTDLPACPGDADAADCFTVAQRQALREIYDGPRTSTGESIFPGYPPGISAAAPFSGWIPWFIIPGGKSLLEIFGETFMQFMAFSKDPGPTYDWRTQFDFDVDPFRMQPIRNILDATDTNMSQLRDRGGKIIQYHGWADPALTPHMSVNYYESVMAEMGAAETMDFYKLYMVPGMFHCGGGPGPNSFDVFSALVEWVEFGIEPQAIIASHSTGGVVDRTRPLCPHPQVAEYTGAGDINDAANFFCADR